MENKVNGVNIQKVVEIDNGFELLWKVFQEFVAPDYSQEGIDTFYKEFIQNIKYKENFATGKEAMYGAYIGDRLVGVLSLSINNTLSCLFVDGKYQRLGVGKRLFDFIVENLQGRGVQELKLNASPYAIDFYHRLGFEDNGEKTSYKGMVYTPMKMKL